MLCLHGKPTGATITPSGAFWECGEHPSCHFTCHEKDAFLYDKAVKKFLATKQAHPKCCMALHPTLLNVTMPESGWSWTLRMQILVDLFSRVQKTDVATSSGEMKSSFRNHYVNMENRVN